MVFLRLSRKRTGFVVHLNPSCLPTSGGGADAMTVECGGVIGSAEYRYVIHKPRTAIARQKGKTGMPREDSARYS